MPETQRSRDIARAALLRERVLGALQASPDFMTRQQLIDWPSVAELYHQGALPGKVQSQLRTMIRQGVVERSGRASYRAVRRREGDVPPAPSAEVVQHLKLEVSKSTGTMTFVFQGLQVSIKVLP